MAQKKGRCLQHQKKIPSLRMVNDQKKMVRNHSFGGAVSQFEGIFRIPPPKPPEGGSYWGGGTSVRTPASICQLSLAQTGWPGIPGGGYARKAVGCPATGAPLARRLGTLRESHCALLPSGAQRRRGGGCRGRPPLRPPPHPTPLGVFILYVCFGWGFFYFDGRGQTQPIPPMAPSPAVLCTLLPGLPDLPPPAQCRRRPAPAIPPPARPPARLPPLTPPRRCRCHCRCPLTHI